jgi:hypothetical protein
MANEIYHRSNWGNAVNDIAWGDTYEKFDATNEMFVRSNNYENSNETDKLMAAINPKPSILLTPTAYDNGSLHSVKPVKTFGSELVTNGTFDTDSDWTLNAAWTISNGKATYDNSATQSCEQSLNFEVGKKYLVNFEISDFTTNYRFDVYTGVSFIQSAIITNQTSYSILFDGDGGNKLRFRGLATGTGFSLDNVSVKEVTEADFDFTRGSSATRVNEQGLIEDVQILSGELVQNGDFEQIGSELVTNGDFDTDSDWTLGNGWIISGGKAILVDGLDPTYQIYQSISGLNTKNLKVTFDVTDFSGDAELRYPFRENITGNGSYTFYGVGTLDRVQFQVKSGFTASFSIDNVSVKEVGQNWVVADGWSIENGKANVDTSEGTGNFKQFGALTVGKKYRLSLSAAMTVGRVKFQSDAAGVFIFSSDVSNHEFIASTTSVSFRRFDATTSGYIDNVSIIEITDDTDLPRIDYTNGTGSLLLEPQSTNLLPYSEDFSFWSSNEVTTQTGFLAPDGSSNATKVVSTGSNSYIVKSGGVFGNYARTIYAKTVSGTGTLQLLSHNTNTNNSFTITENWQRFELNSTTEIASNFYAVDFRGSSTLSEVIIWGAQAENLSYATSYIPTSGSTVTRDAEVCNNSGSSDLINSTEGVLYAEIAALDNDGTNRSISISDGTDANRIELRLATTDDRIQYNARTSSVTQASIFTDSYDVLSFNKIALLYKDNDFRLFVNGTKVATDTSGTAPTGLKELAFDLGDGSNDFHGNVKSVAVFKEALDNDQLERLTGEGYETFNLLAQANNYTII